MTTLIVMGLWEKAAILGWEGVALRATASGWVGCALCKDSGHWSRWRLKSSLCLPSHILMEWDYIGPEQGVPLSNFYKCDLLADSSFDDAFNCIFIWNPVVSAVFACFLTDNVCCMYMSTCLWVYVHVYAIYVPRTHTNSIYSWM